MLEQNFNQPLVQSPLGQQPPTVQLDERLDLLGKRLTGYPTRHSTVLPVPIKHAQRVLRICRGIIIRVVDRDHEKRVLIF